MAPAADNGDQEWTDEPQPPRATVVAAAVRGQTMLRWLIIMAGCLSGLATPALAKDTVYGRTTLSLDGKWDVQDSIAADLLPTTFGHTTPVPGLTHSAQPAFPDVDKYQTKQLLSALVAEGRYSQAAYDKLGDIRGIAQQSRNYFWYHKRFQAPPHNEVAIIKVGKAQFGTVVYLNGVRIGEHWSCFTAGYFDVTRALRWNAPNELVIRIGAHPGVLPATVSHGTDFEKNRWTPGIYDSVSLMTMDNPVIETMQVAPRLASAASPVPSILIQTELRNYASKPVDTALSQRVFEWKSSSPAARELSTNVHLAAGETRLIQQVVPLPNARLWRPEDPFLYRLDTHTTGDNTQTRFGMREFRFDTVTQRAYLNGRPYFMRGSNIALNRFFEDPQSGTLPWNEAWLQRLLVTIPKQLHWNSFRFAISAVPDRWLEIADENGLLIENEYPVWVGSPIWTKWKSSYDVKQMTSEYSEWMRDGWNHPSVVIWDASNESYLPELTAKVLPAVRSLDLSHRAWENSYNDPGDGDDPVEDHHYFTEALQGGFDLTNGGKPFELADLEWIDGSIANPFSKSAHAKILNEYGWLWLNRDGSPTLLTDKLYPKLLGDRNTTVNRRALYANLLGGETELWRAFRRYAGVMSFVYLTSSAPGGFTSDQFIDIQKLEMEPQFARAMQQAFNPLGVYLNLWRPFLDAGSTRDYTVYMVNDEDRSRAGTLRLTFSDADGHVVAAHEQRFTLNPLGAQSYTTTMAAPTSLGRYTVQAIARPDDLPADPTISRREVTVQGPQPVVLGKP